MFDYSKCKFLKDMASETSNDKSKNVLLKDVLICPEWATNKNAFVWKYFGKIVNSNCNDNRLYCIECLTIVKTKSKNENDLFNRFVFMI